MSIKYTKPEKNELPKCPYCEKDLPEIKVAEPKGIKLIPSRTYFCPHCKKVLGIGSAG